jgi:hypothetical protein
LLPADHRPTLRLPFGAPSCCPDRLTPISSRGVGPVARVSPDAWPSRPSVSFAPSCEGPMRVHSRPRTEARHLRLSDANPKVMFRPRGFSPPRRVSPRKGSQACCILQPTLGFATFHTDQPKPAAIPATRPPLEGCSQPPVVLRSPGALAPLAFALADSEPKASLLTRSERLVARSAPTRRYPCGWSVTSAFVSKSRRPILPGLLSPLRGHAVTVADRPPPSPGKSCRHAHRRCPGRTRGRLARCRCRRSRAVNRPATSVRFWTSKNAPRSIPLGRARSPNSVRPFGLPQLDGSYPDP